MRTLHIGLLGEFRLTLDDQASIELNSARERALLAYLLLNRQTVHRRQQLAFLFWPDSVEARARANLRRTLHHLRGNLPDADRYLQIEGQTLRWRVDAPFTLDVAEFDAVLNHADETATDAASTRRRHLEEAASLYRGDLLAECYDDWILPARERVRTRYIHALEQLALLLEESREYRVAIDYANKLLQSEPLYEETYRLLMRLYALAGDRAAALRTYHSCVTMLERELGVGPSDDLQEAYQRLLQQEAPAPQHVRPTRAAQGTVPLVGRQEEWRILRAAWQGAARGRASFVLIAGEAGIGKTRLAEELLAWTDRQGIATARTRAYSAAGDLAYAPVIEWLRSPMLRASLDDLDDVWLSEIVRLLPELTLERPMLPRPGPMEGSWQRRLFYEALARVMTGDGQPKLLLIDDLQWCDSETLAWLTWLMAFDPAAPLLILGTVRSEEVDRTHPLTALLLDLRNAGRLIELELGALNPSETDILAAHIAHDKLGADAAAELYAYTEGNPLYVTETVRAGYGQDASLMDASRSQADETESSRSVLPSSTLPPKVQTTIQYRLAQLSPAAHNLACLAAVIGRSFTFPLLNHASDLDEDELMNGLDELWQRRIVRELPDATYDFSHDRIREVALTEAGPVRRRLLHQRVAQALESLYPDKNESLCGQLGWHYAVARQWTNALHYYRLAATVSADIGAADRVLIYSEKVLTALDRLPNTSKHVAWRIDCWLDMARALISVDGWTAPKRKEVLDLAHQWATEAKDERRQVWAIGALGGYYANLGDWHTSHELSQEMLAIARESTDDLVLQAACLHAGSVSLHRGELLAALESYRQGIAVENETSAMRRRAISIRGRMAETLWLCGYAEQSRTTAATAIQIADAHGHPHDRIHSRELAMYAAQRARETEAMQRIAQEVLALCAEFDFPDYALCAQIVLGWLVATTDNSEIGSKQIAQALASMEEMNARFNFPYYLSLLAQAECQAGQIAQALRILERALELTEQTGDMYWKPELLRLIGDLWRRTDRSAREVEGKYEAARSLASQQQAKMLELRATVNLAHLWHSQGNRQEAYEHLSAIYGWFTEGFQSKDLQEARALLTRLAENPG